MDNRSNNFFDNLGKIFSDAGSAAQGLKKEAEVLLRAQAEKIIGRCNLVQREEFDVLKDALAQVREERNALVARIEALEASLEKRTAKSKKEEQKLLERSREDGKNVHTSGLS